MWSYVPTSDSAFDGAHAISIWVEYRGQCDEWASFDKSEIIDSYIASLLMLLYKLYAL